MLKNEYPSSYNAHDVDNMSVQELDDLLDYLDSMQNKANGGMMLDNTKTYHQANDYTAPPDLEVMIGYANGGGVGSMMQPKKKKFEMQGGVRNYLGKQKEVKAPLNWQSSPDHPKTELAYITKKEKDLLVKKDLHGSLKGGVNRGPSGIMSLNGWGSYDGPDTSKDTGMSGAATSAAETGSKNLADIKEVQAYMGPKGLPPGVMPKEAEDYRNAFIAAGGGQRVNPGFFDSRNYVSPAELAAAKAYNPAAFAAGRKGSGLLGFLGGGGILGALVRGLGQKLGFGKTYNEPTYDMSEFNDLGLLSNKINPTFPNDLGNEIALNTIGSKKLVTPPGWTIQDEMVDVSNYKAPPTGIMMAGGYPNVTQEYMDDQTNYRGPVQNVTYPNLANQINKYPGAVGPALATNLDSWQYNDSRLPSETDLTWSGITNNPPTGTVYPGASWGNVDDFSAIDNQVAFAPNSIKDRQLKQAWNIYTETGMEPPNLKSLMKEDLESGGQLSLDEDAYSLIG